LAQPLAQQILTLEEFKNFGPIFKSSAPLALTESETEYQVQCTRHLYASGFVVLQFTIANTLERQAIGNINIELVALPEDVGKWRIVKTLPCATKLVGGDHGVAYVAIQYPTQGVAPSTTFQVTLKFDAFDVDAGEIDEGSKFADEYQVDDVEIPASAYIKKVQLTNAAQAWEESSAQGEAVVTFGWSSVKTLKDAVGLIITLMGMQPCDRTEEIPDKRTKHILWLAGQFSTGQALLGRARMKTNGPDIGGVSVELTVRSEDAGLSKTVASAVLHG
jgi:coatomer protein complex subunit gamma